MSIFIFYGYSLDPPFIVKNIISHTSCLLEDVVRCVVLMCALLLPS